MASKTEPAKISREDCEQYDSLNESRLSLQRQARTLAKQLEEIEEKLLAFTRENGGKARTVNKFGFILAILLKNGTPSWKDEFIRVAGLDEAEQVAEAAAATKRESFSMQRVS